VFRYPDFHSSCQVAQRHIEDISNLPQAAHGRVKDSPLDPTDVCSIKAALAAEALLRVAGPFAKFTNDGPNRS